MPKVISQCILRGKRVPTQILMLAKGVLGIGDGLQLSLKENLLQLGVCYECSSRLSCLTVILN